MDNILFSLFPPISEKHWKQQIQYSLKGEDYQKLIHTNSDGISTLPFYTNTNLEKFIDVHYHNNSKATYYCIITDEKKANSELLEVIERGITTIYLALFNPKTNLSIALENINCQLIIQCYFLEPPHTISTLKNKQVVFLYDCLGKLTKTGNWYATAKTDFETLHASLKKESNSLSINLSTFQNAGATTLQQISYAISQLKQYSKKLTLSTNTIIYYHVSLDIDMYMETSKIKALRVLHRLFAEQLGIDMNCKIIQHKSKRSLSGLHSEINEGYTAIERQIAILAGVDYFLSTPKHFFFYKEDIPNTQENCETLNAFSYLRDSSITEGAVYIEKLTQQLIEKALILIQTIEVGGGYLEQLKRETIQHKTATHEKMSTLSFLNNTVESTIPITHKKTPIAYPFLKFKKRKTLWKPVIEKQLRETIELPVWKKKYSL